MKFHLPIFTKGSNSKAEDGFVSKLLQLPAVTSSLLKVLDQTAVICVSNVKGEIVYGNTEFLKAYKQSLEEIQKKNLEELIFKHDPESFKDFWTTVSAGKVWRGAVKSQASGESFSLTEFVITPVRDDDDQVMNYLVIHFLLASCEIGTTEIEKHKEKVEHLMEEVKIRNLDLQKVRSATLNLLEDLDEEKSAVELKVKERTKELEHERNKLLQVTGNIRGGAILLDHNRKPLFINRNVRQMLELPDTLDDEAVLATFLEKFSDTEIKNFFDTCEVNQTLTIPEAEIGAHVFEIFFHGLEETDKNGDILPLYFIMFSDITEAKLLERSKSELVAVASHQLRTPLTAMRGNVEMLLDGSFGEVNKEQEDLLHDVEESTIRLITMVNEMLDITKIEKGDLELSLEQVDPVEIIDSILSDLAEYASRHEFKIEHHKPDQAISIYADKLRLRQVLQNIIDNAIKYSQHPGQLEIKYEVKDEAVVFSFADNGIGIPAAEQSKMFGRFYRASNTARTTSSGSGLGLYIVKSIVEQLDGSITFESAENVGTTFHITLPTVEVSKQQPEHA